MFIIGNLENLEMENKKIKISLSPEITINFDI